jgi:hypothetical protein
MTKEEDFLEKETNDLIEENLKIIKENEKAVINEATLQKIQENKEHIQLLYETRSNFFCTIVGILNFINKEGINDFYQKNVSNINYLINDLMLMIEPIIDEKLNVVPDHWLNLNSYIYKILLNVLKQVTNIFINLILNTSEHIQFETWSNYLRILFLFLNSEKLQTEKWEKHKKILLNLNDYDIRVELLDLLDKIIKNSKYNESFRNSLIPKINEDILFSFSKIKNKNILKYLMDIFFYVLHEEFNMYGSISLSQGYIFTKNFIRYYTRINCNF